MGRDPETEIDLVGYRPVADRIAFVADLARNWARLRARPPALRRIALVLANYPNRDGRIGNGVGLDTPASAIGVLQALARAGYRIADIPPDGDALIARLLSGPTNANPRAPFEEALSFADYSAFFAGLAPAVQEAVTARWGPAERDPFFRPGRVDCGRFAIPGFRLGNVAVLVQPARGYNIDPKADLSRPGAGPAAFLSRRLCLARRGVPGRRDRSSRQARHARMAAGEGARLVGRVLPGSRALAAAASLSVHRQRSRRGHAGQAPRPGGHRRSPDAALDPRRQLRPAGRTRTADRRILRGGARRSAPRRGAGGGDPGAGAGRRHRR